ncbi:MAG: MarR family transcriptional regulator [Collinsella sp.]|nr:MarR family transcriptional regulator [Collinsella sp.]
MGETRFEDFVGLITALSKEIQRIKAREAAKLGLKGADIMCLYYLRRHPEGLTSAELARHAGVTRAAVSRALVDLEAEGFVRVSESEESTRYRALLFLTDRGNAAMDSADAVISCVVREAGEELGDVQRSHMYASLATVLARLRKISRD